MSDYESIRGTRVKYLTSDPTLNSSTEGQVWYNSTTGANKALVQIKAFLSSGNTNIGGYGAGGAGTQTAGLIFGRQGEPVGGPPVSGATEEYNGFSWSEQNDLNTARRYTAGFGTQTAAVAAGGNSTARTDVSEEYDGSSWTAGNNLNTAREGAGAAGILTAGLVFGGNTAPGPTNVAVTETYDGTSYSEVNDLNTARRFVGGCGTQTAALAFGGIDPGPSTLANTESWDGTNWTAVSNLNTSKRSVGSAGTQTHAFAFGGHTPSSYSNTSEEWDGSSWTSSANMATARGYLGGAGTASAAFGATGYVPGTPAPERTMTEEYNSNINAITKAAWASGGAASNSARLRALAGTQTAAFMSGGYVGANNQTRDTEEYNGSSWTAGGALVAQGNNPPGGTYSASAGGTQTAGLFIGGSSQGPVDYYFNVSYEYDGSSWGSPATFTAPGLRSSHVFGVQTAAVSAGGTRPGQPLDRVFEYDGSSWTAATSLPTGSENGGASGILTAGIIFGGGTPSVTDRSLDYDGSSWTAAPTMIYANSDFNSSGQGTQTAALAMRGYNGTATIATSQVYDGSSWSATATAATAVSSLQSGAGTASAGLSAGGSPGAVEEFTGGTSVTTASTLTTS